MSLIWWSVPPPPGVLYIYYILCHFHLCFLRGSLHWKPLVVLFPVPDPIFCFSHSSVPSPAHLPVCAHPAHEEKHDIISWHCLLPTKLSFCSPDNSFPLPFLFSHFPWRTWSPRTGPWNVHCLLWTPALRLASQGSASVYQLTRSRDGPMISIKGVAMSRCPHYARATSSGRTCSCVSCFDARPLQSASPWSTLTPLFFLFSSLEFREVGLTFPTTQWAFCYQAQLPKPHPQPLFISRSGVWNLWNTKLTLCNTTGYIACQTPLSIGFSRQEYSSGLPFPSLGDLPDPGNTFIVSRSKK